MKLYRICTENKNYAGILKAAGELFPEGFTILKADGWWDGIHEHSLIIEIATYKLTLVEKLAYRIKKENKQQAVMVETIECAVRMF